MISLEQMCRNLLEQAMNDGLVGDSNEYEDSDPQVRSSGELVGMANLLAKLLDQHSNGRNQKTRVGNTSGMSGVTWDTTSKKWRVQINIRGKNKSLGMFKSKTKAIAARKAANEYYGFHPEHGQTDT